MARSGSPPSPRYRLPGEIVEDGVTGLHFTPGDADDLATKMRWVAEHPNEMLRMGDNARQVYEEKYTREVNYRQLMAIYHEAIEANEEHRVRQGST